LFSHHGFLSCPGKRACPMLHWIFNNFLETN
jgi:hypothetical protein